MDSSEEKSARDLLAAGLRGEGAHLNLERAVQDMPEALYNEKPPYVPYTFWQQLEHIRIAQKDLYHYATNTGPGSPDWPNGYWPSDETKADRKQWERTIEEIQEDRRMFIELVENPEVDIFKAQPYMDGGSVFRTALLAIDHTAYHLGEFVMGRQILGHWESRLDQ